MMTLHEAIIEVLREKDRPMMTKEIADIINSRQLYVRKDNNLVSGVQISARVKNHPDLFQVEDGGRIKLADSNLFILRQVFAKLNDFLTTRTRLNHSDKRILISSLIFVVFTKNNNIEYYLKSESEYEEDGEIKKSTIWNININDSKRFIIRLFDSLEKKFSQPSLLKPALTILKRLSESECEQILHRLYEIQEFALVGLDQYGKFYNNLVNEFSFGDYKNQYEYSTPQPIAALLGILFELPVNGLIFDPFAGLASTLVEICNHNKSKNLKVIAGDVSETAVSLGSQNLIINNIDNTYEVKDAFRDWRDSVNADCIIINPPLNSRFKLDLSEFFHVLDLRSNVINYDSHNIDSISASVILSLFHLNNNGKAVIVVPNSFLFSERKDYKNLRVALLERNLLSGVISLPINSYRPYTNIGFSLVIIDKKKKERNIFLFDASDIKIEKFENEINRIVTAFKERRNIEDISCTVLDNEIDHLNYDLSPKNYLVEKLEGPDLCSLNELLLNNNTGVSVKKHNLNENEGIPYIQVGDLSEGDGLNEIDLNKVRSYISDSELLSNNVRFLPQNSVLIAKVGTKLKPTLFNLNSKALCNANILILEPDTSKITADYLITQFQSEYVLGQIDSIRRYIGVPNFNKNDVLRIKIKTPELDEQLRFTSQFYAKKLSSEKNLREKRTEDELYNLISGLKHEIKQPISSIGLDVDSLKDFFERKISQKETIDWGESVVEVLPGQTKEDLVDSNLQNVFTRIISCVKDAQNTLSKAEETLNLSKGTFTPERFRLKFLLNEIISIYKTNNCTINISGQDIEMYGDKYQIGVLFRRLIENAIKHGGFGQKGNKQTNLINIKLLGKEASGNYHEIIVENNGKQLPAGFDISHFQKEGITSDRNNGSGFGGYHIKRVIQNHKGEIHLASPNEIGESMFKVRFKIYLP